MNKLQTAFNLANFGDCVTTAIGLSLGATETNPIIAYAFATLGHVPTFGLKLLIGHFAMASLISRGSKRTALLATALISTVVISNLIHILYLATL